MPRPDGPLRDILDIPLLMDDPPASKGPAANDALALFQDDPAPRRKALAGEARHRTRRCPTCSGVVPAGMSLCNTCGLDLETGTRINLDEDLEPVSAGPRQTGIPVSILIVGILMLGVSGGLTIASLIGWQNGLNGAEFLLVICLFGVFASVEFLRRRSIKLLIIAMTLGVLVDVIGLIAIPVYNAVSDVEVVQPSNTDDDEVAITSVKDKLDINRVTWGIAIIFAYALVSVYLNSPPVRRDFERR